MLMDEHGVNKDFYLAAQETPLGELISHCLDMMALALHGGCFADADFYFWLANLLEKVDVKEVNCWK